MTFDEFEAKLSELESGQRLIVHYDVLAELFPPGSSGRGSELDKTINVEACFTFAREHNCGVDNRFKENELLFRKNRARKALEVVNGIVRAVPPATKTD